MKLKSENITFMQFIRAYNFRETGLDGKSDDTQVIRIHYNNIDYIQKSNWFEFGIYDFSDKQSVEEKLKKILHKDVVESYVDCIRHDLENNILNIYLTKDIYYDY